MNDLNSFPIKYAALNLKDINAADIDIYVVASCYLISETKKYLPNNQISYEYQVVFKWNNFQKNIIPAFYNNNCSNSKLVYKTFDSFDDALIYTRSLNKEMMISKMIEVPVEQMLTLKEKLENEVNKAYKIEEKNLEFDDYVKIKKI